MPINNSKKNKFIEGGKLRKAIYAVFVVCLVIWIVAFIQVNLIKEQITDKDIPKNQLTAEQRQQAIAELRQVTLKSPALTDAQRKKAIEELKKAISR